MVSTPAEFINTVQPRGVALYAYHPEEDAFITLPLTDSVSSRKNYDVASECLDAADYIRYGKDAPRTSYTRRSPSSSKPGYSGFKSDKTEAEIALADTFAALYEHVRDSGTRIIGRDGYSFEIVRNGRMVVTYTVAHGVGQDASEFHRYVIPWCSISKEMTDTISVNPYTQEVLLWGHDVKSSGVVALDDWDEFKFDGTGPISEKAVIEHVEEDELDVLLRKKARGEVLSSSEYKLMLHLREKRAWEQTALYHKTKNNPLVQRLAAPNRTIIDGKIVNYDRGILDHPEAWHTHILDYIMSMESGDWFTLDDIDALIRDAGIKLGRSERTQFMSMTAYLLKLVAEGLIVIRDIEGLDVYKSKRDSKTVPLVSVESFTVVGIFKPVQTDIFDLIEDRIAV